MDLPESKMGDWPVYQPGAGTIEGQPGLLQMFHGPPRLMPRPHWHAQVEVNYMVRGRLRYAMGAETVELAEGEMGLFWGGRPHRTEAVSEDAVYAGAHLPLVHFFRLRLPEDVPGRLMQGEVLVTAATDAADAGNFLRWFRYQRHGDAAMAAHAVDELLLRLERVRFEPYRLVPGRGRAEREAGDAQARRRVARICDFIAAHFRDEIDSASIAAAAELHPKYAMSVFRKATGMTLNDYVTLLRLSYAQARLLEEGANVLSVAMQSGFGSLSAFNRAFRRMAGTSPSGFRRAGRGMPEPAAAQGA